MQLITSRFLEDLLLSPLLLHPLFELLKFKTGRTKVSILVKEKPLSAPAGRKDGGRGKAPWSLEQVLRLRMLRSLRDLGAVNYCQSVYHLCSFGSLGLLLSPPPQRLLSISVAIYISFDHSQVHLLQRSKNAHKNNLFQPRFCSLC